MQLRYSYRLDPWPRHRAAFKKAFGCARVVYNEALAVREAAHQAGEPYVTDAQLSAWLTATKKAPELSWLNEVSSVLLQRRAEKLLKRRQRELSRKQNGSANWDKARVKLGRAHARVADARRNFHHQLSTALMRDNQAVAVEDLAVKALGRTRLAKSVHDAGWSSFVGMLEYKAQLYGRVFHRIGRFAPTSRTCSACGLTNGKKPLHVRAWQCPSCGAWLDRDINAAVNVARAAGLAVTGLQSAGKTRACPGAARRSRNPPKSPRAAAAGLLVLAPTIRRRSHAAQLSAG